MSDLLSKHNRESFREFLERGCNCTYVGEGLPFPYADDGPDIFRTPLGKEFCVPQPAGTLYEKFVIDKLMEVHKIEVVNPSYVATNKMAQDIANIDTEEESAVPHAVNE